MRQDRYLRIILTIIAVELLWIGAREWAPSVEAQARPEPLRVIIAGVEIEGVEGGFLPVGVVGSYRAIPPRAAPTLSPFTTRMDGVVTLAPRTTVQVEADRPLPVQQSDYTPRRRPGE
jgi:hypothetical protein